MKNRRAEISIKDFKLLVNKFKYDAKWGQIFPILLPKLWVIVQSLYFHNLSYKKRDHSRIKYFFIFTFLLLLRICSS